METTKVICKRCLLKDMQEEIEYQKLQAYLDSIDSEQKVTEEIYQKRLGICLKCEYLYQGICQKCGCFVEARAIRKIGTCPHEEPRW